MRKERVLSADLGRKLGAYRAPPRPHPLEPEAEWDRRYAMDAELLTRLVEGGTVLATVDFVDTRYPGCVGVALTPTLSGRIPRSRLQLNGCRGRYERLREVRLGEQLLVYLVTADGQLKNIVLGEA